MLYILNQEGILGIISNMLNDTEMTEYSQLDAICNYDLTESKEIESSKCEARQIVTSPDLTMVSNVCGRLLLTNPMFNIAHCYQSM
jgi:hypothetical protein